MMPEQLTQAERSFLLRLARQAIEYATRQQHFAMDAKVIPDRLKEPGASFVTLTIHGELRGCIGALEAYQPLWEDVREHALAAAFEDWRFSPLKPDELPHLHIEISRLTPPQPLAYTSPLELTDRLRPGVDGVILRDGARQATYLPQVWEKIPDPRMFLSTLCQKMGQPPDLWLRKKLDVSIYQVEEFHE